MSYFPRYFALQSNDNYLRYVHEEDVVLHGHLEFSGEGVLSPYTKFELEPAKAEGNKGLFNIRCCYTNKYWTGMKGENARSITACTAAEPVEDLSCSTLFDLSPLYHVTATGKNMTTIHCVQDNSYVRLSTGTGDPTYASCLNAYVNPPSREYPVNNTFAMIDLESFVILPKVVVFKGDNGLYLNRDTTNSTLQFSSSDVGLTCPHDVQYNNNGSVRIQTQSYHFWTAHSVDGDYWIDASGDARAVDPDLHKSAFVVVKGRYDNEVALRLVQNNRILQRVTTTSASSSANRTALAATTDLMSKEAIMWVEEPVVSRIIYDVDLRLKHSRIYDQHVVLMVSKQFTNPLEVDETIHIAETFKKETTRTWKSDVSFKLATPTTIKTGVPLIVDGEVGLWDAFEGRYEWGTDMKGYQTTELSDRITIPANSTIMVHVTATRGKRDVPFSYTQRDVRTYGDVYIDRMDDGVYTGINCYNFRTQVVKIC